MTGQQAINRALRLLGVILTGGSPSNDETADALVALNAMLLRWEANGLSMGFSPIASAANTLPVPSEVDDAVVYNLAVRIAPEYDKGVSAEVAAIAEMTLNDLRRDAIKTPRLDTGLPPTKSHFDINSGEIV